MKQWNCRLPHNPPVVYIELRFGASARRVRKTAVELGRAKGSLPSRYGQKRAAEFLIAEGGVKDAQLQIVEGGGRGGDKFGQVVSGTLASHDAFQRYNAAAASRNRSARLRLEVRCIAFPFPD